MGKSWPPFGLLSPPFLEPWLARLLGTLPARERLRAGCRHPSPGSMSGALCAEGLGVGSCGGSRAAATPCPGLIRSGAGRSVVVLERRAQKRGWGWGVCEGGGGAGSMPLSPIGQ